MNWPKAVVFDMDGVIYDTERLSDLGWREAGAIFGLSNIERTLKDCVGLNKTASDALLLARYGKNFPLDDFRAYTRSALQKRLEENCPLKQGAVEILTWLTEKGIPIAMATSSRRQTAVERLERSGLLSHFSAILGGDTVQHSKPHPEPYLKACSLLGVAPEDAIGVEDSPNGIRSVHAAGLRTVIVPDTIAPTPELTAMAWRVCPSLFALLEALKAL